MRIIIAYLAGLLFGIGIAISGMANPAKVLNFFDVAGTWDPSLGLVMGGALLTTFVGYRLVLRRAGPWLGPSFALPTRADIDLRLVAGAALFGVGWGIAGFCPGGALPALGTGRIEVFAFVGALVAGIFLAKALQSLGQRLKHAAT
ncbi:DUF6691 family protein [Roseobacter sinensis]|uniref:YeeE/YedE family protein n=1 Tax=Roseobacter sinensis TaxID=2931391 RepID=A0ABT3BGS8_9RHOB|nr:DUF6691 family protein [Roseobacter sp. WL0113]MCV3272790.1 YeeE/YedE family protein [Roseobacter sp. WL0113]